MSLYEFSCIRSGWMLANSQADDKGDIVPEEDFERLLAAHDEMFSRESQELSMEEVLAMNKDKVRHP